MSHNIGHIHEITPIGIGPDHATSSLDYLHEQEPGRPTRFVLLHFRNANFPASNRLEVDLGYGMDVFSSGFDFWTRPINVNAFADGRIPIRYIEDGSGSGGVELVGFGVAHRAEAIESCGRTAPCTFTNCDLFLHEDFLEGGRYVEPIFDTFWICGANAASCEQDPSWRHFNTLPAGYRKNIGQAACMIISGHDDHLSTCSGTLVGEDLIFSAGHCFRSACGFSPLDPFAVRTASVVFGYETNADGSKPATYNPRIFKVIESVEYGYDPGIDYILLRIDISNGNTGITPVNMRTDRPEVNEEVFAVHHPNSAVKKFSPRDGDYLRVSNVTDSRISVDLDVAGGSSGSGLYDRFGNVVGTLASGLSRDSLGNCSNHPGYFPTARMLQLIGTTPPDPSVDRDVMIVIDRSGSMSQDTRSGRTKMEEARDAASLFVSMIRQGQGHRVGLTSFSNTVSLNHNLLPNTDGNVEDLIGPAPHSTGKVGDLMPSGATSIGGGLDLALDQFSGSSSRDEIILLLTDGMENTAPYIEEIASRIRDRRLCIVGYGEESNLNGPLLASLAIYHDGSYTVAQNELALKKFFASCFGDIFEAGFLMDPEFELPENVQTAEPLPFTVCGEETVTVVLGWDSPQTSLVLSVETPAGVTIPNNDPNVDFGRGRTWIFLRINLPINGEATGAWKIHVSRPRGGEFPPPAIDLHYFVNVVAKGGPKLKLLNPRKRFYTGDNYTPLISILYPTELSPPDQVDLSVKRPKQSLGNLLTENGLGAPAQVDGDTVPAVYATLAELSDQNNGNLISYEELALQLTDNSPHVLGSMEGGEIYRSTFSDLFNAEGLYTFHAKAIFEDACNVSRELIWSVYVDSKVDEQNTEIDSMLNGTDDTGKQKWTVTLTPKDPYGNFLGPGRKDVLGITAAVGTELDGGLKDNRDGTYSVDVLLDPALADEPGIVVVQPNSAPAVFCKSKEIKTIQTKIPIWLWLLILLLIIIIILLLVF